MSSLITLQVEGMNDKTAEIRVINSLRKYSGVLDVKVDQESEKVTVRYDPNNIIAKDLKDTVEMAGFRVNRIWH